MAYISLGFILLLFFISVHGVINKCYVGGIDESNCGDILKESVLQKYYISNFGVQKKNIINKIIPFMKKKNYEFDVPYTKFNSEHKVEKNKEYSPNVLMRHLYIENDHTENLLKTWNDVIYNGSETYKLKFHNKLVNIYKIKGQSAFTDKTKMLFIKSSYIAASIYYLSNNLNIAYNVVNEGVSFFYLVEDSLYTNLKINRTEIMTWGILNLSLKIDIIKSMGSANPEYGDLESVKLTLTKLENNLDSIITTEDSKISYYPRAYLLMFRSYFLDKNMDQEKKDKLSGILYNKSITKWNNAGDSENRLFMIYDYLLLSISTPDSREIKNLGAFIYVLEALRIPVLSIEDRLMNYEATIMMINLYKKCVEDSDLEENKQLCKTVEKIRQDDKEANIILRKINNLIMYDKKTQNIESNIFVDNEIDEDFIHMIVTMAIDMDSKSEAYKKKIENVHSTIEILNKYVVMQDKMWSQFSLNTDESKKGNETNESNSSFPSKNIGIVYKWLIELNAVLCNGTKHDNVNDCKLPSIYKDAKSIAASCLKKDLHLNYLIYKYDCKNVCKLFSWENCSKPDGWILDTVRRQSKSKDIEACNTRSIEYLSSFNKFINKTAVLIQSFRYNSKTDYNKAWTSIIKAINAPVITPEDRYRNFEAHEIYSMFLMLNNKKKKLNATYY